MSVKSKTNKAKSSKLSKNKQQKAELNPAEPKTESKIETTGEVAQPNNTGLVARERRKPKRTPRKIFIALKVSLFVLLGLAIVLSVSALWQVFQDSQTPGPVLLTLINTNMLILLVFTLYLGRQLALAFLERRGSLRKSRLRLRFLGIFSVIAILPAVLVTGFALFILNQGLETWFSQKVSQALEDSLQVARAYVDEHENALLIEVQVLAQDPNIKTTAFFKDPVLLQHVLRAEMEERRLDELTLYDIYGGLVASGAMQGTQAVTKVNELFGDVLGEPGSGPQIVTDVAEEKVYALVPVGISGLQLLAARSLNPLVAARMDQTRKTYQEYYGLLNEQYAIQVYVTMGLILLTLATLVGAIWVAIRLAGKVVTPVTSLVHATNKVSAGDLDVRLTPHDDDEIGILTQSFNRMTQQLLNNRQLLERKNKELDNRRRTMEALLTGVSAGVVAVEENGEITTSNRTAREQLGIRTGQKLEDLSEELSIIFKDFIENPKDIHQQQIRLNKESGEGATYLVRLVPQRGAGGKVQGAVLTLDDISPLLTAQKVAAWSDVARRLAHEIKNPLTPIQLSAERLKRKFMKNLPGGDEDKDLFGQLTDTIVRQTEQMRGLLNEFSDFARMPTPKLAPTNLLKIIDDVLVLQRMGRGGIKFETEYGVDAEKAMIMADKEHLSRVFTNVVENAVNAILERPKPESDDQITKNNSAKKLSNKGENGSQTEELDGAGLPPGEIKIVVNMSQADTLDIVITDNGKGLPADVVVEDLFDPYVTTRKNGTGLGLAIVRRVMDDHNAQVRLSRRPEGGTRVDMVFPPLKENDELNKNGEPAYDDRTAV